MSWTLDCGTRSCPPAAPGPVPEPAGANEAARRAALLMPAAALPRGRWAGASRGGSSRNRGRQVPCRRSSPTCLTRTTPGGCGGGGPTSGPSGAGAPTARATMHQKAGYPTIPPNRRRHQPPATRLVRTGRSAPAERILTVEPACCTAAPSMGVNRRIPAPIRSNMPGRAQKRMTPPGRRQILALAYIIGGCGGPIPALPKSSDLAVATEWDSFLKGYNRWIF